MSNVIPMEGTFDTLLKDLTEVRTALKKHQEKERELKSWRDDLESQVVARLKEQGLSSGANEVCTVSIKEEIVPTVEDWDLVQKYVRDTGQFELFQKRLSATAYRELLSMNHPVPGVKPHELTRLNFRSK
tara:strand:- start:444 stop:833 length:390 start_codon:yes stop_codon:yes gene_type:complete